MPLAGWSKKFKTTSLFDVDQFKLNGSEKARIALMDEVPTYQRCHYITLMVPGNDGTLRESGRYAVCLGDAEVLDAEGADPENCPACRAAGPDAPVKPCKPRFALNIFRYTTNSQGRFLSTITGSHQIWVFGQDKMNTLLSRAEEHGDLRKKDLVITCQAKQFQKFDIDVSAGRATWMEKADVKAQYIAALEHDALKLVDLERYICRTYTLEQLSRMVDETLPDVADTDHTDSADVIDQVEQALASVSTDAEDDVPLVSESDTASFDTFIRGR